MIVGNRPSVGVELHPGGARIAVLSLKPSPTVVACHDVPISAGDEGRALTIVEKALARVATPNADIHLAFSPASGAMRHLLFTAPKLKKAELASVAQRELKRDSTLDPATAYLAVESMGSDEGEVGLRNLLVALHREPVEEAATFLGANKHVVRSATTAPMALLRAASAASLPEDGVVAVALLDPRRSSLIVLDKGQPRFFRDLPTSSGGSSREADDVSVAQALARELDISLVYFAQQFRPKQVETVMVVGDSTITERVVEWMEEFPRYRLVRFGPSPRLAVASTVQEPLPAFAVAIGAALGNKVRAVPDLLPSDMRGRPERAYALMGALAATAAFLLVTMQQRAGHVERLEIESQRVAERRSEYEDLRRKVERAAAQDVRLGQAMRWNAVVEDYEAYHVRSARILKRLPELMPPRAKVSFVALAKAAPGGAAPGRPPPPPGEAPTQRVHFEGLVRAPDLSTAQLDISAFVQNLGALPGAAGVELAPLGSALETSGSFEQPFILDVSLKNPFPGANR